MANTRPRAQAFVTVTTVHQADVCWTWTHEKLHDTDYHIKVNDSMDRKIAELASNHDVTQDTRYCCQWEGCRLEGESREAVEVAAQALARHLSRFTGVEPL